MNPKARITYRFEPAKTGGAGGGADGSRNGGRLVRIVPEDRRAGDAGRDDMRSAADRGWPGELRFETDVIPWKSPFQDDPDALERLIRETDGQLMEDDSGRSTDRVTVRTAEGTGRGTGHGGEPRVRSATERKAEPVANAYKDAEADAPVPEIEPASGTGARDGDHSEYADHEWPPQDREERIAARDGAPTFYYSRRRRPPAPSWMRVLATVAGAVLTGALFGYLVMSMLIWQPGTGAPDETGSPRDGEADIVLPAAGSTGGSPETSGDPQAASGGPAVIELPAVRYYVLQYGVFSTDAGLAEALAQLKADGYAAAADKADGFRAYAGIAESREAAETLAARMGGAELYIRPLDIPAADRSALEGQPDAAAEFLLRTNDLLRTMSGLSASMLSAGGTSPFPEEAWNDWETSHRGWTEAASAVREGDSAGGAIDSVAASLEKASDAFAAYRAKPAPAMLWAAQSALIEAAVAQRDWLRASGAL